MGTSLGDLWSGFAPHLNTHKSLRMLHLYRLVLVCFVLFCYHCFFNKLVDIGRRFQFPSSIFHVPSVFVKCFLGAGHKGKTEVQGHVAGLKSCGRFKGFGSDSGRGLVCAESVEPR